MMTPSEPTPPPPPSRTVKWRAIAAIVAAFVVGMAAGVLLRDTALRMSERPRFPVPEGDPFMMPAPVAAPFGMDLFEANLTEAQRRRIEEIFAKHRPRLDRLMQESLPRVRAVTDEMDREIRAVLTPEQREKLDRGAGLRLPVPAGPGEALFLPAPRGDGASQSADPAR